MRNIVEGEVYVFPDGEYGNYFGIVCKGENIAFVDKNLNSIPEIEEFTRQKIFLRLSVSHPSMKRAKCKKIGKIQLQGQLNEYANFKHTPVGAEPLLYNGETGESTKVDQNELKHLEKLAIWDAKFHIIPVLRYHFHRIETPFRKDVIAKL